MDNSMYSRVAFKRGMSHRLSGHFFDPPGLETIADRVLYIAGFNYAKGIDMAASMSDKERSVLNFLLEG